jgi:hypothetical protein
MFICSSVHVSSRLPVVSSETSLDPSAALVSPHPPASWRDDISLSISAQPHPFRDLRSSGDIGSRHNGRCTGHEKGAKEMFEYGMWHTANITSVGIGPCLGWRLGHGRDGPYRVVLCASHQSQAYLFDDRILCNLISG